MLLKKDTTSVDKQLRVRPQEDNEFRKPLRAIFTESQFIAACATWWLFDIVGVLTGSSWSCRTSSSPSKGGYCLYHVKTCWLLTQQRRPVGSTLTKGWVSGKWQVSFHPSDQSSKGKDFGLHNRAFPQQWRGWLCTRVKDSKYEILLISTVLAPYSTLEKNLHGCQELVAACKRRDSRKAEALLGQAENHWGWTKLTSDRLQQATTRTTYAFLIFFTCKNLQNLGKLSSWP